MLQRIRSYAQHLDTLKPTQRVDWDGKVALIQCAQVGFSCVLIPY